MKKHGTLFKLGSFHTNYTSSWLLTKYSFHLKKTEDHI